MKNIVLSETWILAMKQTVLAAMAICVTLAGQIGCSKPPTRREARRNKRVETLTKTLSGEDPEAGVRAAEQLANMGPAAAGAAPALIDALGAESAMVRAYAAAALGKICKSAGDATRALRKSLEDPDGTVRVWSALALFRIEPDADPEIKVIADVLADRKLPTQARIEAAVAVVQMGPKGKGAVKALIAALEKSTIRRHAAYALGAIGPDAGEAVDALRRVAGMPGPAGQAARTAIKQIQK